VADIRPWQWDPSLNASQKDECLSPEHRKEYLGILGEMERALDGEAGAGDLTILGRVTDFMKKAKGYDAEAFAFFLMQTAHSWEIESLDGVFQIAKDYLQQKRETDLEICDPEILRAAFHRVCARGRANDVALEPLLENYDYWVKWEDDLAEISPLLGKQHMENFRHWLLDTMCTQGLIRLAISDKVTDFDMDSLNGIDQADPTEVSRTVELLEKEISRLAPSRKIDLARALHFFSDHTGDRVDSLRSFFDEANDLEDVLEKEGSLMAMDPTPTQRKTTPSL